MLDLLQAVHDEGGPGVPVHTEPPQLGQHPGVGRVTAVDRQLDRPARRVTAGELLDPPDLAGRPGDIGHLDVQVRDPFGDLGRRRQAQRRAHGQVQARSHAPAQRDTGDGVDRQRGPAGDRSKHSHGDQNPHRPVHRTAQIRQRGGRHGDRDRDLGDRIAGVHPGKLADWRAPGRRPQQDAEHDAHAPGHQGGHRCPPDRGQPRDQQPDDDQQHADPGRTEPEDQGDQPADRRRRRVHGAHDAQLGSRIGPHDRDGHRHHDNREPQPERIRCPPPGRAAAPRSQHGRAQPLGQPTVGCGNTLAGRCSHRAAPTRCPARARPL